MNECEPPLWTDLWALASDMINCTECRAPQFMQHRRLAFTHKPWCSREGIGQYPYQDLLAKLQGMAEEDASMLPSVGTVWVPPKD
jgi:hypothetical protein